MIRDFAYLSLFKASWISLSPKSVCLRRSHRVSSRCQRQQQPTLPKRKPKTVVLLRWHRNHQTDYGDRNKIIK